MDIPLDRIAKYQPVGRFDASTAAQHEEEMRRLLDGDAHSVELDFSNIEFLSSAGLMVLLVTAKAAEAKGGTLQLRGASAPIRAVIRTVGFADIVNLRD
jgi:anti-anti-sigma factor